jgi:hypothetical protein
MIPALNKLLMKLSHEDRPESRNVIWVCERDAQLGEHSRVADTAATARALRSQRSWIWGNKLWRWRANLSRDFAVVIATFDGLAVADAIHAWTRCGCYHVCGVAIGRRYYDFGGVIHVDQIQVTSADCRNRIASTQLAEEWHASWAIDAGKAENYATFA